MEAGAKGKAETRAMICKCERRDAAPRKCERRNTGHASTCASRFTCARWHGAHVHANAQRVPLPVFCSLSFPLSFSLRTRPFARPYPT